MAFSSPHYTTSEPPLEVRYFYHREDTRKVDTICNVLRKEYCFLNVRLGGDISDLRSGLPKNRGFIPLLFLSNTSLEHSLILSELYKTGLNVSLRVCMLDDLVDDVSTLRLVDDRKHLIDGSKSASMKHLAFLIVKDLIPDGSTIKFGGNATGSTIKSGAHEIATGSKIKSEAHGIATGDWDRVLNEDNTLGLYYLLKQRQFPSKQQLAETCEKFGRKSKFFTFICDLIGYYINKYRVANYIVWPAYKVENEKHIIFVTDNPNFEQISDLEIKYWNEEMADSENSDVIKKAVEDNTMIPDEWMSLMKNQINNHSAVIREKHKNISIITASPFRSKGYKTGKHEMITENCMVLLVPLKGFIPIQEDPIPKVIGGIKTDVREDSFQWHVGGNPFIEHNDLKMGCAIGSSTLNAYGTLGGFVEHPRFGLCAITCAHVLLDESEMHLFRSAKFEQNKPRVFDPSRLFPSYFDRECVQPNNSIAVFGKLKTCIWEDRGIDKPGIDVALIKVEARFPISGYFPDIDHTELKETGFKDGNALKYTFGKVCLDIKAHKRCHLVKYGATTTLTHGVFGFNGLELAYKPVHYSNRLVMRNQIQVNHIYNCQPFSKPGDSGSLVFIVLDNELVAAGLLLGGGKGFSVVTPICDVLQAVGCERQLMKTFPDIIVDEICSNGKEAMEVDLENASNTLSDGMPQLSMLPISEVV